MANLPKIFSIIILLSILWLIFLNCKNHPLNEVNNITPNFSEKNFLSLEKLYSIDITTLSLTRYGEIATDYSHFIDFDKNNNMYVLDAGDNTITVFNKSGEIAYTLGRTGQGPKEFDRSNALIINEEELYVFEFTNAYKVVNLEGEYITKQYIPWINRLKTNIIGNAFYVFEGRTDRSFTDLDLVLSVKSKDFLQSRDIFKYKYPPGLQGPNYEFIFSNWILITKNGEFYFPVDNLNTYSIVKYNKEGKPLFKFGKKYKIKKYSEKAKDRFNRIYNNMEQFKELSLECPVSPPVVRKMILDDHGYIWIISGETTEDNRNPDFENTIDIFNQDGIWLYSFKSKLITQNTIYNNGRLFVVSPIDEETYGQFINVYKINYMSN